MTQAATLQHRHAREIEHFDRHYAAEARGDLKLSVTDKLRYTNPPADTAYPREYFHHLMAPLAGRHTLEIACGNGIDASICAHNGAIVHAYDLSPQAVQLTRRRADVNGLADRVHTQVTGDFAAAFAGQTFDTILGYATLHHLSIAGLAEQVYVRLRPGGMAVFAEPVVNSKLLGFVRRCIPYRPVDITDDERPLNDADIAAFARPFDRIVRREFQFISRIHPLLTHRPRLVGRLHRLDRALLRVRPLRRFASVVVFALYRDR